MWPLQQLSAVAVSLVDSSLKQSPPERCLLTSRHCRTTEIRAEPAQEWTPNPPTRVTPITPVAPGDRTDTGMFPVNVHLLHI